MISSKIDFEFNDFVFILITKSSIASLKSIIYNEVFIFKALSILNSILYFFLFSSTRFRYDSFSNSTNPLSFFSKLSFSLLSSLIFDKKIAFNFNLNFLTFEIGSETSTFFLFLKGLIKVFENILCDVSEPFIK